MTDNAYAATCATAAVLVLAKRIDKNVETTSMDVLRTIQEQSPFWFGSEAHAITNRTACVAVVVVVVVVRVRRRRKSNLSTRYDIVSINSRKTQAEAGPS